MPVGEELDGINVGLMPGERLNGLAGANVPELGESVASARDKGVLVCRVEADTHDVAKMVGELNHLGAGFDIPLHAGHITGRGDDAAVVYEAAARQVAGVTGELTGDLCRPVAVLIKVVDGADIIETTTGDIVAARGISASHDP